jgi:endonuclease/exonuclease/phosphatase family metal-dependent hydrolase
MNLSKPFLFLSLVGSLSSVGFRSTTKVTFMSYNIRLDIASDKEDQWNYRRQAMVSFIAKQKPDFLGVQEVLDQQRVYLAEGLANNYSHIGVGRDDDGIKKGEYANIFYNTKKWLLIKDSTFWLSSTPQQVSKGWDANYHRICTFGIFVNDKKDTIVVSNVHLDHEAKLARKNSVAMLKTHINRYAMNHPAVLIGDFNLTPDDPLYKDLSSELVDSFSPSKDGKDGTFTGFKLDGPHPRRIDYIFADPKHWKVDAYKKLEPMTKVGRHVSDHFPIIARLYLR